ncbi:MAG: ornithine cyclodeaminase family protein [Bryobacteraceae bacterium]|jgi:ornithine cyclodeaminase/alanine dehydrogenase-like protein (mu-crystallin family)
MAIWLNEEDVRAVLPLGELIECLERTLAAFSAGQVRQPLRTVIEAGLPGTFFATMPAFLEAGPVMGAKLVTVFHMNGRKGLPTHQAAIVLLDAMTGSLLAVMDGRYITEVRTAAASAVALRALGRSGAKSLALVGSGVQAGSHLAAFALVRKFDDVRCWSPTEANLRKFAVAHPEVRMAASAQEAVRGADVVVIVTSSVTPVVESEWVADGACVISVGACRPTQREMDPRLVARGRLIADSRAAALTESGDVVMAMAEGYFGPEHIAAELGAVLSGAAAGRTSETEVTIYKPLGIAVEDVAAAQLVYARARSGGRGVSLG